MEGEGGGCHLRQAPGQFETFRQILHGVTIGPNRVQTTRVAKLGCGLTVA